MSPLLSFSLIIESLFEEKDSLIEEGLPFLSTFPFKPNLSLPSISISFCKSNFS